MRSMTKGLIGTLAGGAMTLGAAAPAQAQWRGDRDRYRDDGGISAGEIIAGALIIGGIAAVASSVGRNNRDRYHDSPRDAVERCVNAAERTANRYSYGGRSEVTDIRNVDRNRNGYRVRGRIAVNQMDRDCAGAMPVMAAGGTMTIAAGTTIIAAGTPAALLAASSAAGWSISTIAAFAGFEASDMAAGGSASRKHRSAITRTSLMESNPCVVRFA